MPRVHYTVAVEQGFITNCIFSRSKEIFLKTAVVYLDLDQNVLLNLLLSLEESAIQLSKIFSKR